MDLTPFNEASRELYTDFNRLKAGRALAAACHGSSVVNITGHGLGRDEIAEALSWAKRIFDLPFEEKIQASGPPAGVSQRGYSVLAEKGTCLPDQDSLKCISPKEVERTVSRTVAFQVRLPEPGQGFTLLHHG